MNAWEDINIKVKKAQEQVSFFKANKTEDDSSIGTSKFKNDLNLNQNEKYALINSIKASEEEAIQDLLERQAFCDTELK